MYRFFILILSSLILSACSTFHSEALTPDKLNQAMAVPDDATLVQEAMRLHHPRLPPMTLDFSRPLTPSELAVISVLVNPGLKAFRAKESVSDAQVFNAGLLPDPKLSAGLDHPVGNGPDLVNAYSLGLDWDVAALIARHAAQRAAGEAALQTRYSVAWQEWLVANQTALQAIRVLYLEKQLAIATTRARLAARMLALSKENLRRRDAKIDEYGISQAALIDVQDRALALARTLEKARQDLNRNLGLPPARRVRVAMADYSPPVMASSAKLFEQARASRLDLLALQAGYASQQAKLHEAILGQYPRFSLGLTNTRDTAGVKTIGLGISLSLPVFNRNRGLIRIARATREQLFAEYAARLHQTRADIATLHADLQRVATERSALEQALSALEKAEKTMRTAVKRHDVNFISYDVVRANLLDKELRLLELKQASAEQYIALQLALGRLLPEMGS